MWWLWNQTPEPSPHDDLTTTEFSTLAALVERGPLSDVQMKGQRGLLALINRGFAVRVMCGGRDGFAGATYAGRDVYQKRRAVQRHDEKE